MGRSRYRFGEAVFSHFLICTVVGWLPVFTRPETVEIVLNSWRFLQDQERLVLLGDVVHENPIHNPVKRGYVSDPTHRRCSSARNYARMESLVAVTTDG